MHNDFNARRRLLKQLAGLTGSSLLPVGQLRAADDENPQGASTSWQQLEAAPFKQQLDPELPGETAVWAFSRQLPGPQLNSIRGQRLGIKFSNGIDQPSAVHWHGIRIDNAMDGVVGLTQPAVLPGGSFNYNFITPDAGTFWYHAHMRSSEQVGRGLYGILVVAENNPPDVDQDQVLALDDWRLDSDGQIHSSFGSMRDISHQGRTGNWLTVNGRGSHTIIAGHGERLRLRLCNTANSLIMRLQMPDWPGWLMALDGMPLVTPLADMAYIELGPGQRADVFVDCTAMQDGEAVLALVERDQRIPMVRFAHEASRDRATRQLSPPALEANLQMSDPDLSATQTVLTLRGGAMGDLQQGSYKGQLMDIRELVKLGKAWALNGQVDMPMQPLFSAQRGSIQEIVMVNQTSWPHAMHTHGHHFEVIEDLSAWQYRGQVPQSPAEPVPVRQLRDTVLVNPHETVSIRLVTDNPGKWLLHCHMLEHQAGGMVTWFEVS